MHLPEQTIRNITRLMACRSPMTRVSPYGSSPVLEASGYLLKEQQVNPIGQMGRILHDSVRFVLQYSSLIQYV